MKYSKFKQKQFGRRGTLVVATVLMLSLGLTACGKKEAKPGQTLASVNGEEITVLQLNEELQRAGTQAAQQEEASKQVLEALIDRQVVLNEASKDKLDRDPKVMQAIERAKALIIAQAYMQKKVSVQGKPTAAEVSDYFNKHPEFFSQRKQLDMRQVVFASKDINEEFKGVIDGAKTLDEVIAWMTEHSVKFSRGQSSRSSADLPSQLVTKLLSMPKGQLFIVKEGERSVLTAIVDVKDTPVQLDQATGQIEQFLFNQKNKAAADAELARLRAAAKIEYLNGKAPEKAAPASPASAPSSADAQNARGVAGLK